MKLTVNRAAMVICLMAAASCVGGGSCCQGPAAIVQVPVTPTTTGAKVNCSCTLNTSDAAQKYGGFPPSLSQSVMACLPENFAGNEDAFCNTSLAPWLRTAAEQIALLLGPSNGVPSDCVSAAACAGTCYGGLVSIPDPIIKSATCTAVPFMGPTPGALSIPEAQCMVSPPDGGAPGSGTCAPVTCSLTTDPTLPNGANCLIQNNSIDFSNCNCTEPSACGNSTSPICALAPGTADPPVLLTSPMGLLASRTKEAVIDHDLSVLTGKVDVDVFCVIACDHASGNSSTHVTGKLNLYGGPCPGSTCNVQLDGIAYVDDFSMHVTDDLGTVDENHAFTGVDVKLAVPTYLIPVDANGFATIPAGQFSYDLTGFDNGVLKEGTGVSDQPVTIHIDWAAGMITATNLVETFGGGNATLNLTATFNTRSLVDQMQTSLASFDVDGDGVPDRLDNCPLVANPTQQRVAAPGITAPANVTVTNCQAPKLGTPTVTDVCGAGGIVVSNNAPLTYPFGATVVTWTATDARGNAATATQTVTNVDPESPYVQRLANGDMRYSITFPAPQQAYVEAFVRQNGVQNISGNIVSSQVHNADGTFTYARVVPASQYHAGDVLNVRFYSYRSGQQGVFTPGPVEWLSFPDFIYGGTSVSCQTGCRPTYAQLPDGSIKVAHTFTTPWAYVEAFVRDNSTQVASGNIVQSGIKNIDGTYTYSRTVPASSFKPGDAVTFRYYSYVTGGPAVFTPGPTQSTFYPGFVYNQPPTTDCP